MTGHFWHQAFQGRRDAEGNSQLCCHAGGPASCAQAMFDDALSEVFGRSDRQGIAAAAPELMCFDAARSVEEAYALRLRSLLYHQAEERERLQTLVRPSQAYPVASVWLFPIEEGCTDDLPNRKERQTSSAVYAPVCDTQDRTMSAL